MLSSVSEIIEQTTRLLTENPALQNTSDEINRAKSSKKRTKSQRKKERKEKRLNKSQKLRNDTIIHAKTHFNTNKFIAPCLKQRRQDLNLCLEVYDKKLFKLKLKNEKLAETSNKFKELMLESQTRAQKMDKKATKLQKKLDQLNQQEDYIPIILAKLDETYNLLKRTDEICSLLVKKFLGQTDLVRDIVGEIQLRKDILNLDIHTYICDFNQFMVNFDHLRVDCENEEAEALLQAKLKNFTNNTSINAELMKTVERQNLENDQLNLRTLRSNKEVKKVLREFNQAKEEFRTREQELEKRAKEYKTEIATLKEENLHLINQNQQLLGQLEGNKCSLEKVNPIFKDPFISHKNQGIQNQSNSIQKKFEEFRARGIGQSGLKFTNFNEESQNNYQTGETVQESTFRSNQMSPLGQNMSQFGNKTEPIGFIGGSFGITMEKLNSARAKLTQNHVIEEEQPGYSQTNEETEPSQIEETRQQVQELSENEVFNTLNHSNLLQKKTQKSNKYGKIGTVFVSGEDNTNDRGTRQITSISKKSNFLMKSSQLISDSLNKKSMNSLKMSSKLQNTSNKTIEGEKADFNILRTTKKIKASLENMKNQTPEKVGSKPITLDISLTTSQKKKIVNMFNKEQSGDIFDIQPKSQSKTANMINRQQSQELVDAQPKSQNQEISGPHFTYNSLKPPSTSSNLRWIIAQKFRPISPLNNPEKSNNNLTQQSQVQNKSNSTLYAIRKMSSPQEQKKLGSRFEYSNLFSSKLNPLKTQQLVGKSPQEIADEIMDF